jgi:hypothetical protein
LKYLFVLFWTLLVALPLHAETPRPVPLVPLHQGYAMDNPRVLTQQRLFGLAHGVGLLAATCVREPAYREALTSAYAEWHDRQEATIAASYRDLARYYFRDRAAEAGRPDIARALGLKEGLDLKPGTSELRAACDTFAEALQKPRYDLSQLYRLQSIAWRLAAAAATQARAEACRARLSAEVSTQINEAMELWRKAYADGANEAKTILDQRWADAQIEGTLDEWLAQARRDGRRSAVAERCKAMPQWLMTKTADPDDDFQHEP